MAITIDTTVGGASANSYITSVEADAAAETTAWDAQWTALTDAQKDQLLVRSARSIDTMAHTSRPTDDTQVLAYPRLDQERPTGTLWSSTVIPKPIKDAQGHLAAWLATFAATIDPFLATKQNIKREKLIDVVGEKEYWAPSSNDGDAFLADVIAPLLEPHGLLGSADSFALVR